jgi:hypothetical protein
MREHIFAPTPRVKFILFWLGMAAVFIGAHRTFFLHLDAVELGDWGANALQTCNAKSFHELYGNYSRFGFHHPGPAFFYAYAAGECVLFDFAKVVLCPYSAHAITGVLIQTGFFVWTLAILRRHAPNTLLIPLILVCAGLHFGAVNYNLRDSAFGNIWPPYVLLFPFLCFSVACASMAAGATEDILPAVIAGCFLVHGHVAQPLFVVPFFALACVALALQSRSDGVSLLQLARRHRWRFAAVTGLLAVALLPIGADALRGGDNNLHAILRHLSTHSKDHYTLFQSLTYLGTFLCYIPETEKWCEQLTSSSLRFFAERWYFTAIWVLIGTGLLATARSACAQNRLVRWLYVYLFLGLAQTICWGMLQSGGMLSFNSHFNFGLLFVAIIILLIFVSSKVSLKSAGQWSLPLSIVSLGLFYGVAKSWRFDGDFPAVSANLTQHPPILAAVQGERNQTKFLFFQDEDWVFAVGVALELKRHGFDYAVTSESSLIFGSAHVHEIELAIHREQMPLWNFKKRGAKGSGFLFTGHGLFIVTSPPTVDGQRTEIRFAGESPNANDYAIAGWSLSNGANGPYCWSDQNLALLYFSPLPVVTDVGVTLDIFPAPFPTTEKQRVIISFNGTFLKEYDGDAATPLEIRIPSDLWNSDTHATLSFTFPDAVSPKALNISSDTRTIGYGFRSITFHPAAP